ncbi:hypothetical protein KP79_PYT17166 [Mizuhopecten yessoensis]|uniref:Uncharacterized protein n=1 Tax=Mizuhopecten yessoensis TaxID=6573 RepID=A0A210QHP5_MIZYE|nr:hypothetical protein KP79_PYT17166 [Mizuhopecten yessoensis]
MPKYVTDQTNVDCMSKSGIKFERKENASPGGHTSSSDLESVPDVVDAELPIIERNYNGRNFHMQMSDRNLALIRRRTENLRKKDIEIRERLEKVRQKAKMVAEGSPAKQDVKCCFETGSEKYMKQPKLFPVVISHNETALDSGRSIDSFVKYETPNVMHGIKANHKVANDVVSSDNCVTSQTETGSLNHGKQLNHNKIGDTVLVENSVKSCQKITSELCGNQQNNKTVHDAVSTEEDNMTSESRLGRGERPVPAKRRIRMSLISTNEQEKVKSKKSLKRITNELVDEEPIRGPPAKLKSFVGERFAFDKIKTMSTTCNCVKEANAFTPKRKSRTESSIHQNSSLVQMASPTSLGVSPMRLQLHRSAKKTRMISMLASPLIGNMKMTITKTILNKLKKDRCSSKVF